MNKHVIIIFFLFLISCDKRDKGIDIYVNGHPCVISDKENISIEIKEDNKYKFIYIDYVNKNNSVGMGCSFVIKKYNNKVDYVYFNQ